MLHPLIAQTLIAQVGRGGMWGYSFEELIVRVVIVAAIIGILYVALDYFGVKIPGWLLRCIGIVIVAFVAIICIRLLASM